VASRSSLHPHTTNNELVELFVVDDMQLNHTMRDAILTCAQKLTRVSLIYRTEPTTEKWKIEKLKTDMLKSIGKQPGKLVESVLEKKRKAEVTRLSPSLLADYC